ncbi:MAG TPA: SpoIID/LytB domain-containing protein [Acidimicrobiia bacterium]|nr:SpoIID/LytB domain-containing protein [Acidimicrobiia bacterium]
MPFAALAAALLVVSALATLTAPAAEARGSGARKAPPGPKVPAIVADVARIEPLAVGGAGVADRPTVSLEGVGEYHGVLELRRTAAGVGAVNDVALEDYLAGISEVPSSWPAEALRAQAIAARTYLLWVLGSPPSGDAAALGAQICATDSCQVYSGVGKERAPNGANWAAAVRDTAGLALLSGGTPILAKYSACNGGRSVSGGKPYLKAVDDPDDARCPLYRWGLSVSYDDVGRALAVPGTVKAVRATPEDVQVDWTGGDGGAGHTAVPRTEFRARVDAAVSPPEGRSGTVPSILFTLRPDDAARVASLDGRGYGHGIGMSQWGAYGKALRGLKAAAILAAYYGGIEPARAPAAKLPARVRVAISTGASPQPPADPPKPPEAAGAKPAVGARPAAAGKPAAPPSAAPAPGPAVVSASGPFRVLDSRGNVVVPVATGSWRVVPAAKGLQLLPPRDQAGPAGVSVLGVEPADPLPGQAVTVRFRSNLPGVVSATAEPPGGPVGPVLAAQYQFAPNAEYRLTLPAAARPGPYRVTLATDSGPGRTASATATPTVADPAAAGGASAGGAAGGPGGSAVPSGGLVPGGLFQALIAPDRIPPPPRASRSAPRRPPAPSSTSPLPDGAGLGVLLAGLAGFAVWRLRARALPSPGPGPAPGYAAPPAEIAGPPD